MKEIPKKLDAIVIKPQDIGNLSSFFYYFNIQPTDELKKEIEIFQQLGDKYTLEDQERFRIAFGNFIAYSDHPLFNFSDKIKQVVDNIRENTSMISFNHDLEKSLEE